MESLVIAGAGGFGREVYDLVEAINRRQPTWNVLGFLDDNRNALDGVDFPARVLGPIDSYSTLGHVFVICAVGNPRVRREIVAQLDRQAARWATLRHPESSTGTGTTLGEGCILASGAGTTVNCEVGRHVHFNVKGGAGHDVRIGDFCTLSALVDVTGQAVLEEGVFLGSHAVVLPKARVGAWAQVGAGSVVLRSVRPGSTVMGNPAKEIRFS